MQKLKTSMLLRFSSYDVEKKMQQSCWRFTWFQNHESNCTLKMFQGLKKILLSFESFLSYNYSSVSFKNPVSASSSGSIPPRSESCWWTDMLHTDRVLVMHSNSTWVIHVWRIVSFVLFSIILFPVFFLMFTQQPAVFWWSLNAVPSFPPSEPCLMMFFRRMTLLSFPNGACEWTDMLFVCWVCSCWCRCSSTRTVRVEWWRRWWWGRCPNGSMIRVWVQLLAAATTCFCSRYTGCFPSRVIVRSIPSLLVY